MTLAAAIVRTHFRTSAETDGRPGLFRCDSFHQYCLNRRRCQVTTVAGCTMTSAVLHCFQIFMRNIQNRRSQCRSFGCGCSLLRIANWCRNAAFSNAICWWPQRMRIMNRKAVKTALSMTRYFAFNVIGNQSNSMPYGFWRRTPRHLVDAVLNLKCRNLQ